MSPRDLVRGAAFALALAYAGPALAGPPSDQATAATLFEEAKKLAAAGDYQGACPKFAEAQRLYPTAGTLLNLGDCHEKTDKLASAWGAFKEAEVVARNGNDTDREQEAQRRAGLLAPRLAKLAIVVPMAARVPGFELKRDGSVVGEAQWGSALPVDVGGHTVEASAPGRKAWSTVVRIETNGAAASVEAPVLEVQSAAPQLSGSFWSAQRVAGASVGGAGVVSLVLGSVFGVRAIAKKGEADKACLPDNPNLCYPEGMTLRGEEKTAGTVSTATFVVGGILVAGGAVLMLTAPRATDKTKDAVSLHVAPASAGAGFALGGRW